MSPTIDGRNWVAERLKHLRAALESGELTDAQRVLVETEIDQLESERKREKGKFLRWLFIGGRR